MQGSAPIIFNAASRFVVRQLVVLGSSVTALAVARSAHRLGLAPVLFDVNPGIAAATRIARVEVHPGMSPTALVRLLVALARESPSALISSSDDWLRFITAHRRELEDAYLRVLHPGNLTLSLCLDKGKFAAWCERHGLPTPRRYRGSDLPLAPFPLLVRPAEGGHPKAENLPKAVEVQSTLELDRLLERYRRAGVAPVLSESLLGRNNVQYSVGLARDRGQTLTVVARKLRPAPRACATGTCVETTQQADVEKLAQRAADLLDYWGIAEIEVLRDEATGENFIIEVNARPWLQFGLADAIGHDLLAFVLSDGGAGREHRQKRSAMWLDFDADFYTCFGRDGGLVRNGRLSLIEYLGTLGRANVFARWSRFDPRPFWRASGDFIAARAWRLFTPRAGLPMRRISGPTPGWYRAKAARYGRDDRRPWFSRRRRGAPRPRRIRAHVAAR